MTDDRTLERAARSWLEEGPTRVPDRAVDAALSRIQTTRQERGPVIPWRLPIMVTNRLAIAGAVAVVVLVVGALALNRGSRVGNGNATTPLPSLVPTTIAATPPPSSTAPGSSPGRITADKPLQPGRYFELPFGPGGMNLCFGQPGCTENLADETMRFTFTVPDGWIGGSVHVLYATEGKAPPAGAGLVISRGGGLYAEPCGGQPPPNILVGASVDDFVSALVAHPKLDVTAPVDVSLAGYSGKYVDLQVPADLSACQASYFPWEPGIYAQGAGSRWHLWILDVEGIRVVIQSTDYEGTSPARQAELRQIVESIEIEP